MNDRFGATQDAGFISDLRTLRRYAWIPAATLILAVGAALAIGAVRPGSGEARFRMNVLVDALPPLFGPPLLPGPFEYAGLATSDAVVQDVAQKAGVPPDTLKTRLRAEARFNRPEVDFFVTGANSVGIARVWHDSFVRAATDSTPELERTLTQTYTRQLDQAKTQLDARAAAATANPADQAAQQALKAAQENYETASRLSQSYDVVASTMKAQPVTVVAPHEQTEGLGSTRARVGAAVAIGLLAGVLGALGLAWASRKREDAPEPAIDAVPPAIRRAR